MKESFFEEMPIGRRVHASLAPNWRGHWMAQSLIHRSATTKGDRNGIKTSLYVSAHAAGAAIATHTHDVGCQRPPIFSC